MARVRGAECLDALRPRWRNASLKTSFMAYMLGFLLLALMMSAVTAGMFSGLQHREIADAYEISGLYLNDAHNRTLVPARAVDIDENGSSVFVQIVRGEMTETPLTDLSSLAEVTDASDYQYSPGTAYLYGSANDDALSVETPEAPDQAELTPAELPAYDAKARDRFDAWLAANPDSPYTSFFDGDSQDGDTVGLLTSAVGYYVNALPSEEAQALSSAHDLRTPLTILKGKIELLDAHVQSGNVSVERLTASVVARPTRFDSVADMVEDAGTGLAAHADRTFAPSVSARCDRERPELCVDHAIVGEVAENLLNNAMCYASSQVDARLDVRDGALVLLMEDDGRRAVARFSLAFCSEQTVGRYLLRTIGSVPNAPEKRSIPWKTPPRCELRPSPCPHFLVRMAAPPITTIATDRRSLLKRRAAVIVGLLALTAGLAGFYVLYGPELGAGYAFGFWEGTLWCLMASALGTAAVMALVRVFGIRIVGLFFSPDKITSMRRLRDSRRFEMLLFLCFLIPGTPKGLLTYVGGLGSSSIGRIVAITTVGRIPPSSRPRWRGRVRRWQLPGGGARDRADGGAGRGGRDSVPAAGEAQRRNRRCGLQR